MQDLKNLIIDCNFFEQAFMIIISGAICRSIWVLNYTRKGQWYIQPFFRKSRFLTFQIYFQNGSYWENSWVFKKVWNVKMLCRICTLRYGKGILLRKLTERQWRHFSIFPRFGSAHCTFWSINSFYTILIDFDLFLNNLICH